MRYRAKSEFETKYYKIWITFCAIFTSLTLGGLILILAKYDGYVGAFTLPVFMLFSIGLFVHMGFELRLKKRQTTWLSSLTNEQLGALLASTLVKEHEKNQIIEVLRRSGDDRK